MKSDTLQHLCIRRLWGLLSSLGNRFCTPWGPLHERRASRFTAYT